LCSLVLYPSSAYEMPVLVCGVLKWDGDYNKDEVYNNWPTKEICDLVIPKNIWRLAKKSELEENKPILRFVPSVKIKQIAEYSVFILDLIKVESSPGLRGPHSFF